MSKTITLTLPDKAYKQLRELAKKEKIREVTLAAALLRRILENENENE